MASVHVLPRALSEGRAHRNGPVASIDTPAFRSFWRGAPYTTPEALCAAYERAMAFPQTEVPDGRRFAYCEVQGERLKVEGEAPPNVRAVFNGWVATNVHETGGDTITLLMVRSSDPSTVSTGTLPLPCASGTGGGYRLKPSGTMLPLVAASSGHTLGVPRHPARTPILPCSVVTSAAFRTPAASTLRTSPRWARSALETAGGVKPTWPAT